MSKSQKTSDLQRGTMEEFKKQRKYADETSQRAKFFNKMCMKSCFRQVVIKLNLTDSNYKRTMSEKINEKPTDCSPDVPYSH